jgi:DNA-binding winged helix-turn-helix (wHTH) protein/Tfp pilus assembly protein PilF
MDVRSWTEFRRAPTDLAKTAAFELGPLTIDPSIRRIEGNGRSEILEPRVMRVLVALGEIPGRVLSRDELIELCWDGQLVTDNAITRVISLLRHALEDLSGGAVHLETITKVGFRVVVEDANALPEALARPPSDGQADPFRKRKWTRRAAAVGVLGIGAGAALAYVNRDTLALAFTGASPAELYRRGQAAQKSGEFGSVRQALALYKKAVTIDPNYAPAWGALALIYRHPGQGPANFTESPTSQPQLIRSAAERALALDPNNVDAKLALIMMYPKFRRWQDWETRLRVLVSEYPNSALVHIVLGLLLTEVDRFQEALDHLRKGVALDPTMVAVWGKLAMALHEGRRDQEAQMTLDRAFVRFPKDSWLWNVRYWILIGAKRYAEAAAFVRDPDSLPDVMGKENVDLNAKLADALATGKADEKTAADLFCTACKTIESAPMVVPLMAACGAENLAFEMLEAYFLGGVMQGIHFPPPGAADQRLSFMLFAPQVLAWRDDPRYARLLQRIGLEDYWRASGQQPDFRRT